MYMGEPIYTKYSLKYISFKVFDKVIYFFNFIINLYKNSRCIEKSSIIN